MQELTAGTSGLAEPDPNTRRGQLVSDICDVLTQHQLQDYGHQCVAPGCGRELYGQGGGMTLSRHRAEKIADMLIKKGLVSTSSDE